MRQVLTDSLLNITVGEPASFRNMTVFPLYGLENGFHYVTLDEALADDKIEIKEIDQQGHVPELRAANKSDEHIFLLDGEELIGAKQNRILNASIMIAPKSEVIIPVSCVERGRWSYRSMRFRSGPSSDSRLRILTSLSLSQTLAESGKYSSDQLAIWAEIQRKQEKLRSYSPSGAYESVYADYKKELDSYVNELNPPKECSGVAVVINDRVECLDVFDSVETLRKLWNKLVRSYAIGALEDPRDKPPKTSCDEVRAFIRKVEAARMNIYDSIGLGADVRVEAKGAIGAALVCKGRVVHAALFNLRNE